MLNEKFKIKNGKRTALFNSIYYSLNFLVIIFSLNNSLFAQSVDSLVAEAIANNPKLKSLQYRIQASEKREESVDNLPAPNLSVEFSQVPIKEINVFDKAISNSISLSQMFPLGGKLNAMAEVERKNTVVESDNYQSAKVNLIAQVKMTYYNLWLIDRKIDVQRKNILLIQQIIESVETSYYTNKISQADILSLQSEIALNETQLVILENQKEAEIYKLEFLLGRQLDSKNIFTVENINSDSSSLHEQKLDEILIEANPSLKRMTSMIAAEKAMIEANNKELIPDLMIQGMLMRMPRGMILTASSDLNMLEPGTEIMYSLMFSINLPFAPWSINKYKAKEEELAAGIKSIEYEKNDMQREMSAKLNEAVVKYKTAASLTKLYRNKVIPLYTKASESQVSEYQNNKTNVTVVIDSYRMLLMQQMNYFMAQADTQMSIAEIEMMIGREMDEF
ncbi:MAG: hypothetical protein A2068_03915 [Ignavibacteria bacterium GWB2_35_6b]|nr:MAG: hypothetical protein A2068_03915 [Ignavibacteria bacterium GWB2_35_6b]